MFSSNLFSRRRLIQWHFEHSLVSVQLDHVASSIQDRGTLPAPTNVFFHGSAQSGFNFAIEIVGNFAPHFFAVHYHGFVPFAKDNELLQAPPSPGPVGRAA